MPRVLSMRHTIVTPADRDAFHARARRLRGHYGARHCHYWLFEDAAMRGAYVEFFEAADPAVLEKAHADAPDAADAPARTYIETGLD